MDKCSLHMKIIIFMTLARWKEKCLKFHQRGLLVGPGSDICDLSNSHTSAEKRTSLKIKVKVRYDWNRVMMASLEHSGSEELVYKRIEGSFQKCVFLSCRLFFCFSLLRSIVQLINAHVACKEIPGRKCVLPVSCCFFVFCFFLFCIYILRLLLQSCDREAW